MSRVYQDPDPGPGGSLSSIYIFSRGAVVGCVLLSLPVVPGRVMILYLLSPVPHHNAQFLSETSSSTLIHWTQGGAQGQLAWISTILRMRVSSASWGLMLVFISKMLTLMLTTAHVADWSCCAQLCCPDQPWLLLVLMIPSYRPTHMYCVLWVYTGQMMLASLIQHTPLRPHTPQPSKRGENGVLCWRRSLGPAAWVTWPIVV